MGHPHADRQPVLSWRTTNSAVALATIRDARGDPWTNAVGRDLDVCGLFEDEAKTGAHQIIVAPHRMAVKSLEA